VPVLAAKIALQYPVTARATVVASVRDAGDPIGPFTICFHYFSYSFCVCFSIYKDQKTPLIRKKGKD
jgi:hypothetical protein